VITSCDHLKEVSLTSLYTETHWHSFIHANTTITNL